MTTSTPSGPIIISKPSLVVSRSQRIPGTFPSVRYGEQVVSTGIPSLDSFIGGGIPMGSVCIVKDTFPSRYGNCVLKTFMAEGATYDHHIFVACGLNEAAESLINDLPILVASKKDDANASLDDKGNNNMKIAWRYGHHESRGTMSKDITKFEFSTKSSAADLGAKHVTCSRLMENSDNLDSASFKELLQEIFAVAQNFKLSADQFTNESVPHKPPSNLVRICLSHCEEQVLSPAFLPALRAIVRHTNSCALITLSDVAAASANELVVRCEHFADYVIALQAVTDEKRRTDLGDIDGICDVLKISSINSLKPVEPPRDLGFSFKKKRLLFHELNLPPEGESTTQREVSTRHSAVHPSSTSSGCGSTFQGKSIDF